MSEFTYYSPKGGLPPQGEMVGMAARFEGSYAFLPAAVLTDIVTSNLPHWAGTRAWVIARPMTGFAETFAQLIVELEPQGGSTAPEPDPMGQGVVFVVEGSLEVSIDGHKHDLGEGGYAYLPAGCDWTILNTTDANATFHWVRKKYQQVEGIDRPDPFVTSDGETPITWMPGTNGKWGTTRFVDPNDMRHDMHVNIVTFEAGGMIPFPETHVMEHGLYVLEGKANYLINTDWVPVEAGDFMWLRAFCPQACKDIKGRFRYLLYKDVNRHVGNCL